ncbi:MAG: VOC family protein [Chloroflexota bacterium]|nr:VOC family protein [Chloroflexota bacterium]
MNPFGHIDLRVPDLAAALLFYEQLLPALGFTRSFHSADWCVFAGAGDLPGAAYFAVTEDRTHQPNANLIGFWAADRATMDRLAALVTAAGGTISAGPQAFPISPTYYAVYFTDPCGNRYEITYRVN